MKGSNNRVQSSAGSISRHSRTSQRNKERHRERWKTTYGNEAVDEHCAGQPQRCAGLKRGREHNNSLSRCTCRSIAHSPLIKLSAKEKTETLPLREIQYRLDLPAEREELMQHHVGNSWRNIVHKHRPVILQKQQLQPTG